MLGELAVSGYILPPPNVTFADFRARAGARDTVLARLAKLAQAQAQARTWLNEQSIQFDALYQQARDLAPTADDLEDLEKAIMTKEQDAAAVMVPQLELLQQKLERPAPNSPLARSLRRSAEEAADIGASWLEQYQKLRLRLLKLASDRRGETEPASPVYSDAGAAMEHLRKLVTE